MRRKNRLKIREMHKCDQTFIVNNVWQVITHTKHGLRTGDIFDKWFKCILILFILWPPGPANVFKVTPCTLTDGHCSQWCLNYSKNKEYIFHSFIYSVHVTEFVNVSGWRLSSTQCRHCSLWLCLWETGLPESQLMGLPQQSWIIPNLTSWSHCGNQRHQHLWRIM